MTTRFEPDTPVRHKPTGRVGMYVTSYSTKWGTQPWLSRVDFDSGDGIGTYSEFFPPSQLETIDRAKDADHERQHELPEPREIQRQVLANGIGRICDVEGAVHVHLTVNADSDREHTADVLLEVAAERERQRGTWGHEHDDSLGHRAWMERHQERAEKANACLMSPGRSSIRRALSDTRSRLVEAMALLGAHIEAIDRRSEPA